MPSTTTATYASIMQSRNRVVVGYALEHLESSDPKVCSPPLCVNGPIVPKLYDWGKIDTQREI